MIQYFCNLCGKVVTNRNSAYQLSQAIQKIEQGKLSNSRTQTYDVCRTCQDKIKKMVKDLRT